MQFALNSIAADPIFGEYGSYYVLGSAGKYAHNILSAWVDLGILGFSLLVALLARLLINYVIAQRKLNPATPASAIAFHALGYGLLMQTLFFLMAAKNFTDLSVAAVVGITGAFRAHMKALDIRAT